MIFDFFKTLTLMVFLLFSTVLVLFPISTYAISLDDDEEDAEDVIDYLQQAKVSAKNESFDKANRLLKKAKTFSLLDPDVKKVEKYIATKKKERDDRVEKAQLAKLEKERKEKERLARIEREKEERNSYSYRSSSSSASSTTLDFVMVEFDVTCGLLNSCIEQNLNISGAGGTGNFNSNYNGASTGAIHKGYDGKVAGRYSWSAEIKSFDKVYSCSGSFYISGTKRNYAIRVYDNCSDALSGEY